MVNYGSANEFCAVVTENVPGMLYLSGQKVVSQGINTKEELLNGSWWRGLKAISIIFHFIKNKKE